VSLPKLLAVVERETPPPGQQIAWVRVNLEFPEDIEKRLEKIAQEAGLCLKCYCLRVLLKHLLEGRSSEQQERWQRQIPATLRRNGCDDRGEL